MPPIVTYAPKMPVPAWSEIAQIRLKTSRDNFFITYVFKGVDTIFIIPLFTNFLFLKRIFDSTVKRAFSTLKHC